MPYNKSVIESRLVEKYHEELRTKDLLLGQIRTVNIIHDGGIIYDHKDNEKQHKTDLIKLSSSIVIKNEVIEEYRIEEFSIIFYEFVMNQIGETVKMIVNETTKIAEFTGNIIDVKGAEMDGDKILNMIEKMPINFNGEGKPVLPQIFCGSDMYKKFENFKLSQTQQQEFDRIIESKKADWYAKKRYRKLSYIN